MLKRILSMIPEGNRRFPLRYKRMLNSISDRMLLSKLRFYNAHSIPTPGIATLRFVCLNMNIAELDNCKSDMERYNSIINGYCVQMRTVLDPMFTNTLSSGKFIKSSLTSEILMICEFTNPYNEFPFEKDWLNWKSMRGVRMMYHDSLELPEEFVSSMIQFKVEKPKYLMVAINLPLLCLKYYKYICECRRTKDTCDVNEFLKEYEYSYFFDDLVDIWILNLLQHVLSNPERATDDIIKDITMPVRFCTVNMMRQGIDGIKEFISILQSGSMKPQDFLVTKWFNDRSLIDLINENCYRWVALPAQSRYLWMKTLHQFPYFSLLVESVRLFPDTPFKDTINLRCKEIFNYQIRPISMPSAVTNPVLGDFIRSWQEELSRFLNNGAAKFPA